MGRMGKKRIGEVLLDEGLVQPHQLTEALQVKSEKGGRLGEILIGLGWVTESDFQQVLARHFDLRYMDRETLLAQEIDPWLLQQIPYRTALQYLILPLLKRENTLHVSGLAPLSPGDARTFRASTRTLEVKYVLATRQNLKQAIRYHYGRFLRNQSAGHYGSKLEQDSEEWLTMRREGNCVQCGYPNKKTAAHCIQCGTAIQSNDDPFLGKTVGRKWRLTQLLGEGGMGMVYRGIEPQSQEKCAIKLLRTQLKTDDAVVQRFYREVQILRKLKHPGIIEVYDFAKEEGIGFYLAMELLEGCTFADYLEEPPAHLNIETICVIICQLCDAMQHAHNQGVVHRDLKPENIFLVGGPDQIQQIKLLDFGIAKLQEHENNRLTMTGMTLGTPHYLSPEQAVAKDVDHRSDIYSLSVILFELLTGDMLFDADSPFQYLMRHVYSEPRTLAQARPNQIFSPKLEALVRAGLAKTPHERPSSMTEFKQRMQEAVADQQGVSLSQIRALQTFSDIAEQPNTTQAETGDYAPVSHGALPTVDLEHAGSHSQLPSYIMGADEWDDEPEPAKPASILQSASPLVGTPSASTPIGYRAPQKAPQPKVKTNPPSRKRIRGAMWEDAHRKESKKRLFVWFGLILCLIGGTAFWTYPQWKQTFEPTPKEVKSIQHTWKDLHQLPQEWVKRQRWKKKRRKRRRRRYRRRRRKRR